jgi:hypothetical protein
VLTLEIDDVTGKQATDVVSSLQELSVGSDGEEIGVAEDGELGLEPEQVAFCSPVQLPLLGCCVAPVTLSNVTRYGECGEDDRVRRAFGFAPCTVPNDAEHLAPEGDGLLPDFEITDASSHGAKMTARALACGIDRTRFVSKPLCDAMSRT